MWVYAAAPLLILEKTLMPFTRHTPLLWASALTSATLLVGNGTAAHAQLAPSNPDAPAHSPSPGIARISGGVMAGQILTKVAPVYPPDAKDAKVSGSVVLHAIINKDGTIENLTVISGPEQLRASALDAVRQWTYKPYILNGNPVEIDTTITVNYNFGR